MIRKIIFASINVSSNLAMEANEFSANHSENFEDLCKILHEVENILMR